MAVFLVTPLSDNFGKVREAIRRALNAEDFYELQGDAGILVAFDGTSLELSHRIGITSEDRDQPSAVGSAMVTTVGSYYGRGPTVMWEWLKSRFERAR